ncbi:PspC domain-containing protein [Streptomyces sp. NPDC101152]|uniref:PspC domain-containing protein n=1 Tax=Streptomyces sp. NPDC101152 TaxID=3366116 RepID=UPI0037F7E8CF
MTDHQHAAATGPGPGSGPGPVPGAGPQDAAPAAGPGSPADSGPASGSGVRAHADAGAHGRADAGARKEGGAWEGRDARETQGPREDIGARGTDATDAEALAGGRDRRRGEDLAGAGQVTSPGRFRRDRQFKMLAGVCSGLGRQCDMDPVIFRITLVVLSATGGIGLIFYGFAWLLIPFEGEEENEVRKLLTGRVDGQALTAVLFSLVGCGVFLTMLSNGGVLAFAVVLSLLLAGAGYWSQQRDAPDPDPLAAQAVADAPPEAQAPPVPAAYPSWWRDPIVKDGTHVGGTGYLWGPRDSHDRDIAAAVNISLGTAWAGRPAPRTPRPVPPRPRGPRWIGGWIFLLALLAGGLGTGTTWTDHALGTSLQTGLACALLVVGVGIALSAFLGRTGAGSVFLAMVTAALLAGSAALPKDISTHWIRTTWQPAAVADVGTTYRLGSGVGTLDLGRLRPAKGQTVSTQAEVGAGQLKVIVPKNANVRLSIDVGVGDIRLPGDTRKNVDVAPGKHKDVTLSPVTGDKNAGTLDLGLRVGVGQAEVIRATS